MNKIRIGLLIIMILSLGSILEGLDVFYPMLSVYERALGGANFLLDDETSRYSLLKFDNPAGLMTEPKVNRLDLGVGVYDTYYGSQWLAIYSPGLFKGWTYWLKENLVIQTDVQGYILTKSAQENNYTTNAHFGAGFSGKSAYQFESGIIVGATIRPVYSFDRDVNRTANALNTSIGTGYEWKINQENNTQLTTGLMVQANPSWLENSQFTLTQRTHGGYCCVSPSTSDETNSQTIYSTNGTSNNYGAAIQLLFETHDIIEAGLVGDIQWQKYNFNITIDTTSTETISGYSIPAINSVTTSISSRIEEEIRDYTEATLFGFIALDLLNIDPIKIRVGAAQAYQWNQEEVQRKIISQTETTRKTVYGDGSTSTTTTNGSNTSPSSYGVSTHLNRDQLDLKLLITLFDRVLLSGSYQPYFLNSYTIGVEIKSFHGIKLMAGFDEWENLSAGFKINLDHGLAIEFSASELNASNHINLLSSIKIPL